MLYTTKGMKIYIGGEIEMKSTDHVEGDFSEVWTEITGHINIGSLGDASEEIEEQLIGEGRVKRLKGPRSSPPVDLICALNTEDPGQMALIAAERTDFDYEFRMVFNDAPVGGTASERWFIAKVGSATEQFDTASSTMKLNASLWVNSNVIHIARADAP